MKIYFLSICTSHGGHIIPGDQRALFYHAKPRSGNHGGEAWRGETKLFWSPGTTWPPCDKRMAGFRPETHSVFSFKIQNANHCYYNYLNTCSTHRFSQCFSNRTCPIEVLLLEKNDTLFFTVMSRVRSFS